MERMAKKSGADFDRDYIDEMVDDHQQEVRDFRSMAKSAKDPDLKAFAAGTLPTLEQHLQAAKTTESAVKSADRDRKTTTTAGGGSTMSPGTSSGTPRSTTMPGKDAAATTATAAPGSSTPSTASAPPPSGSASDAKTTSPPK